MTVGGVSGLTRQRPATITPSRVTTVGYSMDGTVQQYDFAIVNQPIEISLPFVSDADRILLQAALETTSKPGGTVSVTPDSGDDLGIGASGATSLYYVPNSFRASVVKAGYWRIDFTLRKLG